MLVPAYSVAKPFTVAGLFAAGADPERSIGDYLECPTTMQRLTLRALMMHRSGLPDYGGWPEYRQAVTARADAWSTEELLERAAAFPLEPGDFRYSNVGYTLLRLALQELTGTDDLFSALAVAVFPQLGMRDVAPLRSRADWEAAAPSVIDDLRAYDPGWVYPGTFLAAPTALETGLRALLQGRLVAPEALLDTTPVDVPGHVLAEPGYGLGLMTSGRPPRYAGHGGGGPGFTLVALATRDGATAAVEWIGDEVSDQPLFRAALARIDH